MQITTEHFALTGVCSPIVIELFDMLKNKGRLHEFSHRILVNYELISLLILNMPDHDPDKHDRIREHVCFIVSVTEQQLRTIMSKKVIEQQRVKIETIANSVHSKFHYLIELLTGSRQSNEKLFKQLQEELKNRLAPIGLNEDQKTVINKTVDEASQSSMSKNELLNEIETAFAEIEKDLAQL